jgi:hypothetical protein|tara:strand:+ start:13729 stop:13938 length:210 start_codon:yes stop_codon:yes gene_type:complete
MYRIIKRTAEVTTNGAGLPDTSWNTKIYGEYFTKVEATRILDSMKMSKHDVSIEYEPTVEELVNTDYFD